MSQEEEDTLKSINLKTLLSLLALLGILATTAGAWFVQAHRVASLEGDMQSLKDFAKLPRYTLQDDERRSKAFTDAFTKELDRRGDWMLSHDQFRLETVKTSAETSSNIREIKNLLIQMKKDVDSLREK